MKQLQESLWFQLVQLCRTHRQRTDEALSQVGLHVGQEMILFRLWTEEGITQTQLAEYLDVEPPTITKMLGRMEQAGFIERHQDSEDARVSRVYLSPKGRELEKAVNQIWIELEERVLAGLNSTEQMLLRRLLMQMRENLI